MADTESTTSKRTTRSPTGLGSPPPMPPSTAAVASSLADLRPGRAKKTGREKSRGKKSSKASPEPSGKSSGKKPEAKK